MDTSQPLIITLPAHPTREDLARLCDELAAAPPREVVCEISALASADLAAVDALARLKLAARRGGHRIRFEGARPRLRALLVLSGLEGTLGL
ncbi:STAS domain-containing protein [Streptomyces sp. NPDC003863]